MQVLDVVEVYMHVKFHVHRHILIMLRHSVIIFTIYLPAVERSTRLKLYFYQGKGQISAVGMLMQWHVRVSDF